MIQDALIPFVAIGLSELGDKTQLAVLCLASKTKRYLSLIIGVMLGFLIADGLAIALGDVLRKFVPIPVIKIVSGIVFIIFGVLMLIKKDDGKEKCDLKSPFLSGFLLVLLSEMGDKTQIAAGLFATRFSPWMVLIGTMLALLVLSLMAVYLGRALFRRFDKRKISIASGILFVVLGILAFF